MITTKKLVKTFKDGETETRVLRGIDFEARTGEFIAIMGRSGAGKSTFLYQISLLDEPTDGEVIIDGVETAKLSEQERTMFRLTNLGYIFQDYALVPELTALENVLVPILMQGVSRNEGEKIAAEALQKVGVFHRKDNPPSKLSGGEQQRVSIARAIAHKPRILFADEPTANLDSESARRIVDLLVELHREGQTIIMVTHENEYATLADRIVHMEDGQISEAVVPHSSPVI